LHTVEVVDELEKSGETHARTQQIAPERYRGRAAATPCRAPRWEPPGQWCARRTPLASSP